jgi:hypothetical protein
MEMKRKRRGEFMPYFTYPYIGWKQQCTNVPIVFTLSTKISGLVWNI